MFYHVFPKNLQVFVVCLVQVNPEQPSDGHGRLYQALMRDGSETDDCGDIGMNDDVRLCVCVSQ